MRAALLGVFLVSCAAPSGRTYRDGVPVERAPVFVTPGYAPAGAGLPEYMPAMERETVPRGTDRRVLPPTREPGVWASDGDETRAAKREDPNLRTMVVRGVALPSARYASTSAVRVCGRATDLALGQISGLVAKLNADELRCEIAREFLRCIRREGTKHKDAASLGKANAKERLQDYEEVHAVAVRFERASCAELDNSDRLQNVEDALVPRTKGRWRQIIITDDDIVTEED